MGAPAAVVPDGPTNGPPPARPKGGPSYSSPGREPRENGGASPETTSPATHLFWIQCSGLRPGVPFRFLPCTPSRANAGRSPRSGYLAVRSAIDTGGAPRGRHFVPYGRIPFGRLAPSGQVFALPGGPTADSILRPHSGSRPRIASGGASRSRGLPGRDPRRPVMAPGEQMACPSSPFLNTGGGGRRRWVPVSRGPLGAADTLPGVMTCRRRERSARHGAGSHARRVPRGWAPRADHPDVE